MDIKEVLLLWFISFLTKSLEVVVLIKKFNKGTWFSLCVIDIFSKYAWAVPLKHKKVTTIVNAC